ncbi:MAG: gamma-glutamyl-gamma-aminobutyrate hydrolase family protein, partial [Thiotrichaceae bacterium]|nr:gamma-glutamyl-gamma-aminobutyrate hydrolase family protein [Thiotrichaceae bacterium]
MQNIHAHRILILDFGSQYTQLIARRLRECGIFCEIHSHTIEKQAIYDFNPQGIILSGSPESVIEVNYRVPDCVFTLDVPVLGICYGMHIMALQLGGKVEGANLREYGYAQVQVQSHSQLIYDMKDHINSDGKHLLDVWMSHGDH